MSQGDRLLGATERIEARLDRDIALSDRGSGASERGQAGHDRSVALTDRDASADDRAHASLDGLTGVYVRGAGGLELEREVARAQRTAQPLVVVYLDVDHLKIINDTFGHAAGDATLRRIAATLRAHLRPYDLIVRYGGDEFVCAVTGMTTVEATRRFMLVNAALAEPPAPASVTVGTAELQPGDSLDTLVARADAALHQARQSRRTAR